MQIQGEGSDRKATSSEGIYFVVTSAEQHGGGQAGNNQRLMARKLNKTFETLKLNNGGSEVPAAAACACCVHVRHASRPADKSDSEDDVLQGVFRI